MLLSDGTRRNVKGSLALRRSTAHGLIWQNPRLNLTLMDWHPHLGLGAAR